MSREIKFRFILQNVNTLEKKVTESYSLDMILTTTVENDIYSNESSDLIIIGQEQFTGLKDKNGFDIYEGDIVKCIHNEGLSWEQTYTDVGVLEFSKSSFSLKCPKKGCENAKDISKRSFNIMSKTLDFIDRQLKSCKELSDFFIKHNKPDNAYRWECIELELNKVKIVYMQEHGTK